MENKTNKCQNDAYICCQCEYRYYYVRSIPCNYCTNNPFGCCSLVNKDAEKNNLFGQYANDWFQPVEAQEKGGT